MKDFLNLTLSINAEKLQIDEEKIRKLKTGLNKSEALYRWVPKKYLGIVLIYLGMTRIDQLDFIKTNIEAVTKTHAPFDLKLNGIWAYPNQIEGRLLWIGVQNSIALRSLQEDLAKNLIMPNTFREDKIFKPILYIVRLKNHRDLTDIISPYKNVDFGKLNVAKLSLLEMTAGGAFPEYAELSHFNLNATLLRPHEALESKS